MRVYIVQGTDGIVDGVFSTEDKARIHRDRLHHMHNGKGVPSFTERLEWQIVTADVDGEISC